MSSGARDSASAPADHELLVAQLRDALGRASDLVAHLSTALAAAARTPVPPAGAPPEPEVERQLSEARLDVRELSTRLVDTEHQLDRLMGLYVASYQLHSYLEPKQVHGAIADIAINLLGAERFVLLLRREGTTDSEVALSQGAVAASAPLFAGALYEGGDPLVDDTLTRGALRLGPQENSPVVAAVPLKIQEEVVGALVVLKLYDHRPGLGPDDRDLLDLLSAHAASALFAARLFAAKDRKLRTLESLVRLARGE